MGSCSLLQWRASARGATARTGKLLVILVSLGWFRMATLNTSLSACTAAAVWSDVVALSAA